ncbi:MAG TPA: hypothetical protein VJK71_09750, partial [Gemmatimonadales bacterium]|nr:hypothetical protein [Gemmatimonadales bacterium]
MTPLTPFSRPALAAALLPVILAFDSSRTPQPPGGPAAQSQAFADLVFRNGRVYTANDKSPHAEAVAVRGNRIVFVGNNAGAYRLGGPSTRVVD